METDVNLGQVLDNTNEIIVVIIKTVDGSVSIDAGDGEQQVESVDEAIEIAQQKLGGGEQQLGGEIDRDEVAAEVYDRGMITNNKMGGGVR